MVKFVASLESSFIRPHSSVRLLNSLYGKLARAGKLIISPFTNLRASLVTESICGSLNVSVPQVECLFYWGEMTTDFQIYRNSLSYTEAENRLLFYAL